MGVRVVSISTSNSFESSTQLLTTTTNDRPPGHFKRKFTQGPALASHLLSSLHGALHGERRHYQERVGSLVPHVAVVGASTILSLECLVFTGSLK